ncbi:MAG: C4-type zinc ribbon domain-containing protein [Thermodesulfobacteriota bacterium]
MKLLIELQACDRRIKEIQFKKSQEPLKVQELRDEFASVERQAQESRDRIESLMKDRRRLETEVQDLEGKIEKAGLKLASIKKNEEYTAALNEIEYLKKLKFTTEDKVLQLMEEIDQTEGQMQAFRVRKGETAKRVEAGILAVEREAEQLDGEIRDLEEARGRLTRVMEKDLLKRYLLLLERKNGQAVSAVIRGVCQTCHLGFPPQKFNELLKGDSLITCPHCNRLVYWGEDQDFQAKPRTE